MLLQLSKSSESLIVDSRQFEYNFIDLEELYPALLAPSLRSSTRKKSSGTEITKAPTVKLRFVGFIIFVNLNFGQVQLLRFIIVMIRSNSFGHLNSGK